MSFPVRGPGWPAVAVTAATVVFVLGLSVSTQERGREIRFTRINGVEAVEGEVLLKYRDGHTPARRAAIEALIEADDVEVLDRRGVRRLRSRGRGTAQLISRLAMEPDVEYVEPNYVTRLQNVPNDPSFTSLWGLFNDALNPLGGGGVSGADIDAPGAWDLATGTSTHVVAVLDTGIDYTHPDLAANMWSAPASFQVTIGGVTVTCAAGTHGFNAFTRTCDPMDDHFHGTHVAGTIGARGNNGVGVTGVNWTTSMMAVKVLSSSGSGTTAEAVAGMEFVLQAQAALASTGGADVRVLSNSWETGGNNQSLMNAVKATNAADMLFVAAAGNHSANNDLTPNFPASYATGTSTPNVIAVAASTNSDHLASFSNYGPATVQLAAPGTAILSTVPGNAYAVAQGTSMAAPHVSGAAMLALSVCDLSAEQLKSLLLASVDPVSSLLGITSTGGRLNVRAALQNCPAWQVTGLTLTPDTVAPRPLGATVTWTAVAEGGLAPHEYRFYVWDGTAWSLEQDWSTQNTFVWTPTTANDAYRVSVNVRSAGNLATERGISKAFPIKAGVSSVTLASGLTAPRGLGTTVTWTATAAGGQAPYQYRFYVWDGTMWSLVQDFSSANTLIWTPSVANAAYKVTVHVRSAWNTQGYERSAATPFAIMPVASSVSLTSDLAEPQPPLTPITWIASASGGQSPYSYRFIMWNGVEWKDVRAWDTNPVFVWTPLYANKDYKIAVLVRSAWNTGANEISVTKPFATRPFATNVTPFALRPSPQALSTPLDFSASATGGQAPYEYLWAVHDGVAWTIKQGWGTASAFRWVPGAAGNYRLLVKARSAWNKGAAETSTELPFKVLPPVSGLTVTPDVASPRLAGSTVTFTAAAAGGQAPYHYRWYVGSQMVRDWSTAAVFAWSDGVGTYQIKAQARSASSNGPSEREAVVTYQMVNPTTLTMAPNRTSPQPLGGTTQWTANVAGGVAPHQFQWVVYDGVNWTNVTPWVTSNSLTSTYDWTPAFPFAYRVAVRVRSAGNTGLAEATVTQYFTIQ